MASTNADSYLEDALLNPPNPALRVFRHSILAASAPATDDTINFFKLPKNVKIGMAWIASTDGDTNGSPTLSFTLRITDDTTTKNLKTLALGGVAVSVLPADEEEGIGFVTDSDSYRVEVLVAVEAATAADMTLTVGLIYTGVLDNGA